MINLSIIMLNKTQITEEITFTFNAKNLLALLVLVLTMSASYSQEMVYRSYMIKTSQNVKTGFSISNETKHGYQYGVFYQTASNLFDQNQERSSNDQNERVFYGVRLAAPLYDEKIQVRMATQTGMANNKHFVIRASLLVEVPLWKTISVGTGIGINGFRPAYQGSLIIRR